VKRAEASRRAMGRHLVGVDIGGSKIAVIAREVGSGRTVHSEKVKTPADEGVEGVLYLGSLLTALSALLDPEAILLGGGASKAGDALVRRLRREVPRHLSRTRLMVGGLGPQAPLYGALFGASELLRRGRAQAQHP
jgi:predicted NBD/HSP70 family sugar kinase